MGEVNYSIYCLYTDESHIYIGISNNTNIRINAHLTGKGSKNVANLLAKGYIFDSDIIYKNLSLKEASELELKLIKEYKILYGKGLLNVALHGNAPTGVSGEAHSNSKLSDKTVKEIRNFWAINYEQTTLSELSTKYAVSIPTIYNIIYNKRSPDPTYIPPNKICNYHPHRKISECDITNMRVKYSQFKEKIIMKEQAKMYNITGAYFSRILRGTAFPSIVGPLLGKDYTNG